MIDWKKTEITEPPLTLHLTGAQLKDIENHPLSVRPFPIHIQSMERAIKEVTNAFAKVFGYEARDGFIKAKIASRDVMPKMESKQDYSKMIAT